MRISRLVLATALLLTTACVAEPLSETAPEEADVSIVAGDMYFEPGRIEVVAGQPTVIHLANDGGIQHDLVLDAGWQSGRVRPGESITVTMDPLEESDVAWCSVPGHRSAGMELEVVVIDGDA